MASHFESQNFLLDYFSKFEGKNHYPKLALFLDKISQREYRGEVTLPNGEKIPDISHSERLLTFHKILLDENGWTEEEREEVKRVCQIYSGQSYRDDGECITMINILLMVPDSPKDDLRHIKDCLESSEKTELDSQILERLLTHEEFIYRTIGFYILFGMVDQK